MASFFYPDLPATVFIQLLTCTTGLFRTMAPSAWQARKDEEGEREKREKRKKASGHALSKLFVIYIFNINVVVTSKGKGHYEK